MVILTIMAIITIIITDTIIIMGISMFILMEKITAANSQSIRERY